MRKERRSCRCRHLYLLALINVSELCRGRDHHLILTQKRSLPTPCPAPSSGRPFISAADIRDAPQGRWPGRVWQDCGHSVGWHNALMLLLSPLLALAAANANWLRLSDTNQGPRYVNTMSARRTGRYASISTELRMTPAIKRTERFDCVRKRYVAEITQMQFDSEGQPVQPYEVTRHWESVVWHNDYRVMLRIACSSGKARGSPRPTA